MADAQVTIKVTPREWQMIVEAIAIAEQWWSDSGDQDRSEGNLSGASEARKTIADFRELREKITG